jgi:plasmid stability protein
MPSHQARQNRRVEHEARPVFTPTIAAPSNEVIQREATGDAGQNIAASLETAGVGQSLDGSTREYLEPKFGHDFASVKIHADGHADQMSKAVNARAFVTGQDVFFRQGEYKPQSPEGMHLLAHELTHTIQQSRGTVSGTSIGDGLAVSDPNDAFEQEASSVADSVARGERVNVGRASDAGMVQRSVDKGQMVLQREGPNPPPAAPAPSTGTGIKHTFETPPLKIPGEAVSLGPVKMQSETKAEISFDTPSPDVSSSDPSAKTQTRAGVTASPTGGVGYQTEVQREFERRVDGALKGWKPSIKGGGKVTTNGGEIALEGGLEGDLFKGAAVSHTIKFTILGVDLKENDITFVGMSYTAAIAAKPENWFPNTPEIKGIEIKGGTEFKFTPDWAQIAKWIGERLAITAGETVIAVDGAAVAASAAAIIAPAGAAALMIAGFIQTGKNIDASRAALGTATRLRREAKDYAKSYASTLTGGSGKGPGAAAAEEKIKSVRMITHKERQEACDELREKNGGYQKIYGDILAALRPVLFAKAVSEFETNYQSQFGILEGLGEDWGMRGVFRRDMRMILFADDD